ncbi:CU044_2847 family protein [Streptomyces sp. NBC_00038]|uniref:CU044_2847 family protein n=1 Tax=Streptomyces sp. NBC_00038 TaxID=2903615 RepID=UPI00225744EE|nr:CU044_2847 family protein [Streptomyces sp. NBC_00038]MCX5562888.1 CU044_2847 family protein [Streptomyces sp. NBC_00038]
MLLDDGQIVLLEVAESTPAGAQRVSRGAAVASAAETLQQALARVRPALGALLDGARTLSRPPGSVTVEFGITLSAEAGVVVARGSTEAHFTVSMQWANPDESAIPGQRDGDHRP